MLRRKTRKFLFVSLSLVLSISLGLIINNFIIISRIGYRTHYEVNLPNSEEIIEKTETFDYLKYLKMHKLNGEVQNLSKFNANYIDREFIDFLKRKINREINSFHWWPFTYFSIIYSFSATEELTLYFSYNNNTIFNATYENQNAIFTVPPPYVYDFIGSWYINFTQVPHVVNQSSTIMLNNTIFIKMILKYDHTYGNVGGEYYQI
ncbi:hypothetical protein LCGC14_0829360 [marine sediment metagenome]|uniref:Uncharacterized protein n=1 Tax=marine sediment metagenome TaxID=412755 RepID=A0A0F9Q1P5_9ZZZZ|nr:MAG: hypothetical protein Lokiarch_12320 [Candidatus Lokiarchaeum sp. GC14_75]